MNGFTNEEIERERKRCFESAVEFLKINKFIAEDTEVVVVDSFFKDAPHDATPIWYLGESIKKMAEADVAVFARGWKNTRGCVVEHEVAKQYGTMMIGLFKELYAGDYAICVMNQKSIGVQAND